jgi:hypothetical protein
MLAAPASAAPAQSPYPGTDQYAKVTDLELYKVTDRDGRWFTTPLGLDCAIEDDGSYGCSGDLPGVPSGENEVGWFVGDTFPRLYHTDEPRFGTGRNQTILIATTYIEYRGSRCVVTRDAAVYCIHGEDANSQLMVTPRTIWRGSEPLPGG